MKRHILFLAGLLTILSLSACSSFESEEIETSDEAYICIGIDGVSTARTIAPTFNVAELRQFFLSGRKNVEDEWSSFNWRNKTSDNLDDPILFGPDTYEDLLNSVVAIKTGTWYEFKLTACINNKDYGSTYFVGTISNKEIVKGKNTLNFTLMPDTERNRNTGYVNVTFRIPSATAVKKAKAGLYKVESDECYYGYNDMPYTLKVTPSEVSDTATAVFSTRSNGTPPEPGTYRLKAWFYADEECTALVSTFCELVKVLCGITTNAGRDIDNLNTVYTITLNEGSYKEGFTPKTIYTRFEGVTLPKEEEMQKSGYTFAGWYTNAEGTGEAVTSIPAAQAENVVLYAKWLEGYWLTADTWEVYSRRGFDGLEEISIHLVGEWTENTFSNFLQKKLIYSSSKISISLDMSQMTGITEIKTKGFRGVVSIKLPAGVTSIGDDVFNGCSLLKSIELPESLTSIGISAFENCESLENIDLPKSLTSIGANAFRYCTSLKSIKIPGGVTKIAAFEDCTSLKSIELSRGLKEIYGFKGCTSLKKIELPETVTTILSAAFLGCTSLESVEFPDSLTEIQQSAFSSCTSLKSIRVPKGVKKLEPWAFAYCTSLETVNLSMGLNEISYQAFQKCESLKRITIPSSVNCIGKEAFKDSGLISASFENTSEGWCLYRLNYDNLVSEIYSIGNFGADAGGNATKLKTTCVDYYLCTEAYTPQLNN